MSLISQTSLETSISIDALCAGLVIPRATYYRHLEHLKTNILHDELKVRPPELDEFKLIPLYKSYAVSSPEK